MISNFLNFLIPQPYEINMDARFNCSRIRNLVVRGQCVQFLRIARRFPEMIRRSNEYLKHKLDTIHDILVDLPVTRSRRKRGFLSDVLGKVTGLATKDEVYYMVLKVEFKKQLRHGKLELVISFPRIR